MSLERCRSLLKEVEAELSKSFPANTETTAAGAPSTENSTSTVPSSSSGSNIAPSLTESTGLHQEHRRLFGFRPQGNSRHRPYNNNRNGFSNNKTSKPKKRATFTRNFMCLSHMEDTVPPSPSQQSALKRAGLGEKKITLNLDDGPFEVDKTLKEAYPQLFKSGGYVLLRIVERGVRVLSVINGPYSCEQLKDVIGQGKIFIRPLQRDLSMNPLPTNDNYKVEDLQEKCLNCQQMFFLAELSEHIEQCCNETSYTATNPASTEASNSTPTATKASATVTNTTIATTTTAVNSATIEDKNHKAELDDYFVQKYGQGVVSDVKCPKCGCEVEIHSAGTYTSESGSLRIYADEEEFECTSSQCLYSEKRNKTLESVSTPLEDDDEASGAQGVDPDISAAVNQTLNYAHNHKITNGVEVLRYFQSIMVTGRPLNVVDLAQATEGPTNYILVDRYNLVQTAFEEIKEMGNLRQTLEVHFYGEEAEDIGGPRREFFRLIVRDIFNIYFENGLKPHMASDYQLIGVIFGLSLVQGGKVPKFKEDIFESVFNLSVDDQCLNLLRLGLKKTGIFQLAINIDAFKDLFREGPKATMTIRILNGFLKPVFSEAGCNARKSECLVYRAFQKYLREVASGRRTGLDLESVLQFVTGSNEEPILGFSIVLSLTFHEVTGSFLPTANTCSNTLSLPRPTREHELPEENILFELYDMAFTSSYFGNK